MGWCRAWWTVGGVARNVGGGLVAAMVGEQSPWGRERGEEQAAGRGAEVRPGFIKRSEAAGNVWDESGNRQAERPYDGPEDQPMVSRAAGEVSSRQARRTVTQARSNSGNNGGGGGVVNPNPAPALKKRPAPSVTGRGTSGNYGKRPPVVIGRPNRNGAADDNLRRSTQTQAAS